MTLTERIDFDVREIELYFTKLFSFLASSPEKAERAVRDSISYTSHNYTVFVLPDMASNVYSMLDFWLTNLCDVAAERRQLPLSFRDIRGTSDLDARHKYLTRLAQLDLTSATPSYQHVDILRVTRNCLLHNGGHAEAGLQNRLKPIAGISVIQGLVTIRDAFIWTSLKHARTYLAAAAQALEESQTVSSVDA